jgi:preprotein translocase subunit SecA
MDFQSLTVECPCPLLTTQYYTAMFGFLKKLFGGTKTEKDNALYQPRVNEILRYYDEFNALSHDELRGKTVEFRERIAHFLSEIDAEIDNLNQQAIAEEDIEQKEGLFKDVDAMRKERDAQLEIILKELLPEAFAVVKQAAKRLTENTEIVVTATDHDRMLAGKHKSYISINGDKAIWKNAWTAAGGSVVWNMIHYDVQLIGGMVLHDGKIAEMATGEGKTLVSTLPAYLNGLSGQGVHIVTVNDYLARRDAEWNGPLYEFLFLTVDCIDKYQPNTEARRSAYLCDITYGTNNEFGFDYLRDNMVHSPEELVQGKHHFAMVDEVDSVLVDDARTPLIISGPVTADQDAQEYIALKPEVERLIDEQRKLVNKFLTEAKRQIADGNIGMEEGEGGLSLLRAYRALPKNRALIKFLSEEGVRVILQKTENNYMQEQSKRMPLVDAPLLFHIDEKNRNVELTELGAEFLSKGHGDSNFFLLPDIATEMMSIDTEADLTKEEKHSKKEALAQDFSIKSQRLHSISQLLKAYTMFEKDVEYIIVEDRERGIAPEVKIVDEQTGRVMEGRRYSDGLHQALEAKENVKIGETTQTYATVTLQNYFRMYHKLCGMTGTAETEASEFWQIYKLDVVVIPTNRNITRKDEEDLVFKTEREKLNAMVDEIEKMRVNGRPVLVGTKSVEKSEILSRMLKLRGVEHQVLNAKQHQREAEIVAGAGQAGAVTIATNMAGRGTDIKLGVGVKESGGLAIVGTERHDSRRVDRQLRGRSGRQGDPGSSQFFVSLEDELMRLFQSERIAGMMDKMGHKDGEVIQHSMVTKSIERAQTKVEENNFGVRKRLLEYDDVMNIQREAIYKKRYNALNGERLAVDLFTMFNSMTMNIVADTKATNDYNIFKRTSWEILGFDPEISENDFKSLNVNALTDMYYDQFMVFYQEKSQKTTDMLLPVCQQVYQHEGHRYKRIAVPFTDGRARALGIAAELEDAVNSNGKTIWRDIEKAITLSIIDDEWKEHLRNMDELKESVQGASFEQKDPLVIYKMEAYNMFENFVSRINQQVTSYLSKGMLMIQQDEPNLKQAPQQRSNFKNQVTNQDLERREAERRAMREAAVGAGREVQRPVTVVRQDPKVGRNDLCPCGSGKKYKNCHGTQG